MISHPGSPRVSTRPSGPASPIAAPARHMSWQVFPSLARLLRLDGRRVRMLRHHGLPRPAAGAGAGASMHPQPRTSDAPMAFDRKCLDAGRSCRPGRCPSRVWMTVTPASRAAASTFLQAVTPLRVAGDTASGMPASWTGSALDGTHGGLHGRQIVAHHVDVAPLSNEIDLHDIRSWSHCCHSKDGGGGASDTCISMTMTAVVAGSIFASCGQL